MSKYNAPFNNLSIFNPLEFSNLVVNNESYTIDNVNKEIITLENQIILLNQLLANIYNPLYNGIGTISAFSLVNGANYFTIPATYPAGTYMVTCSFGISLSNTSYVISTVSIGVDNGNTNPMYNIISPLTSQGSFATGNGCACMCCVFPIYTSSFTPTITILIQANTSSGFSINDNFFQGDTSWTWAITSLKIP